MARSELDRRYQYIEKLYACEDETLAAFKRKLDPKKFSIQLSPVEGKILYLLLKMIEAKKVLEIGTLGGYSSIWAARALPEGGELHTIEKSEQHFAMAQANIAGSDQVEKIKLYCGLALDVLPALADTAPFDAVFIDADKENYCNYLEFAYEYTRKGGLIVADNTFLFDLVLEDIPPEKNVNLWHAMREFNIKVSDQNKYESIILPTYEGLTVALKK
jgi:predicted O-methyltransferase YrrM